MVNVQLPLPLRLNRPLSCLRQTKVVRAYQNTVLKHNKLMKQSNYMTSTISNGCIPKGIKDQSKFRLSFPNVNIQNICQQLFYFAASRTTDVIRTHLNKTVQMLRQTVFNYDAQLKKNLTTKEYHDVIEDMGKMVDRENRKQEEIHTKKLSRDIKECKYYVPWQQYANFRQRRNRRLKAKRKPVRIPSRCMKRKLIRQPKIAKQTTENQSTKDAPPPVINLSSKILTEGHFGVFTKGPKFVPTPSKANFAEFQEDFTLWKNKLRWAYYHQNKPNDKGDSTVEDTS